MAELTELFENNQQWIERTKSEDPDFFDNLAEGQQPDYLWIGCSDSRVPPTQVCDLSPGDMFVHRNIANVILHSDVNAQSVIQYAVEMLQVKHVVVCGHYGCGGVTAAMENQSLGLIDHWIRNIKDVYDEHLQEVQEIESQEEKINRLCELNVQRQVLNVSHSPSVQKAWKNGQDLTVHGLIYSLKEGTLNDLNLSISSLEETSSVFEL